MSPEFISELCDEFAPDASKQRKDVLRRRLNWFLQHHKFNAYWFGINNPAAIKRRLISLSERSPETSQSLVKLLLRWKENEPDTFGLLVFQAALSLNYGYPEKALENSEAEKLLISVARADPGTVTEWAGKAATLLEDKIKAGEGGPKSSNKIASVLLLGNSKFWAHCCVIFIRSKFSSWEDHGKTHFDITCHSVSSRKRDYQQ